MENLSAVIPVYNAEKYLHECVGSVLSQTFTDFELILVDDGSTDGSPAACDELAGKDSRIRVIHQRNSGALNARKRGLQEAQGTYITFPDADDWMDPDYFEKMMQCLRRNDADIAAAGYVEERENGERIPRENRLVSGIYQPDRDSPMNRVFLYCGQFYDAGIRPTLWSKVIRRTLFSDHFSFSGQKITNGDDAAWVYPMISRAKTVVVDNTIQAYHYRMVPGSLWQKYDPSYLQQMVNLIREMHMNLAEDRMMSDGLRYYALNMLRDGINRYMDHNFWKRDALKASEIQPALDAMRPEIQPDSLDWSGFDDAVLHTAKTIAEGDGRKVAALFTHSPYYIKAGLVNTVRRIRQKSAGKS